MPRRPRPLTPDDFRRLALALPEAVESAHMNHPDFRVGGKVFASLGYPNAASGMVKLNTRQQRRFVARAPAIFSPARGVWGLRGSTIVNLPAAKIAILRLALKAAWRNLDTEPGKEPPEHP